MIEQERLPCGLLIPSISEPSMFNFYLIQSFFFFLANFDYSAAVTSYSCFKLIIPILQRLLQISYPRNCWDALMFCLGGVLVAPAWLHIERYSRGCTSFYVPKFLILQAQGRGGFLSRNCRGFDVACISCGAFVAVCPSYQSACNKSTLKNRWTFFSIVGYTGKHPLLLSPLPPLSYVLLSPQFLRRYNVVIKRTGSSRNAWYAG